MIVSGTGSQTGVKVYVGLLDDTFSDLDCEEFRRSSRVQWVWCCLRSGAFTAVIPSPFTSVTSRGKESIVS